MAKRLIDTRLWNNEEIIEYFTAEDKYFWLYLLTSPHNSILGVFKYSPTLIARDTGLHKDTIINLIYRFETVHKLIYVDKESNEVLILNWYKFNWNTSSKLLTLIERECQSIKSEVVRGLIAERINTIFIDKDRVSIGYLYPTNTNTNTNIYNNNIYNNTNIESSNISNSNIDTNIESNIIDSLSIKDMFDKTYEIYPRKVSKCQASTTFEHKLRGLAREEAINKARAVFVLVTKQCGLWKKENDGRGRKLEHIPYFSTWLNDNVEDSPKYKKRR